MEALHRKKGDARPASTQRGFIVDLNKIKVGQLKNDANNIQLIKAKPSDQLTEKKHTNSSFKKVSNSCSISNEDNPKPKNSWSNSVKARQDFIKVSSLTGSKLPILSINSSNAKSAISQFNLQVKAGDKKKTVPGIQESEEPITNILRLTQNQISPLKYQKLEKEIQKKAFSHSTKVEMNSQYQTNNSSGNDDSGRKGRQIKFNPNSIPSSILQINSGAFNFKSSISSSKYNSVLPAETCTEPTYTYWIHNENNGSLIKKCMEHRLNWKASTLVANSSYNFKWKDTSAGLDFSGNQSVRQMLNHYDNHSALSNKLNLFLNMLRYCEKKGMDVFKMVPFTITIQLDSSSYVQQLENFKEMYASVADYFVEHDTNLVQFISNHNFGVTARSSFKRNIKRYGLKFVQSNPLLMSSSSDKLGLKTPISICSTHFGGRNLWLIKAVNMNRGRGIKISSELDDLLGFIKQIHTGIPKKVNCCQYEDIIAAENDSKKNGSINLNYLKPIYTSRVRSNEKKDQITAKGYDPKEYNESIKKISKSLYRSSLVIIQKYIERPFLYYDRKCDIRIWVMINHKSDIYAFKEGHLKATSVPYNLNSNDAFTHLTNYSVQKYSDMFSYYEVGNEISYQQFQRCIYNRSPNISFVKDVLPKIYDIIKLTFKSTSGKIESYSDVYCFEIFGYDFMLDENLVPFLLEVNTNPGYEESSPLIKKLIPRMIDDCLRLTIDDVFPTKYSFSNNGSLHYSSPFSVDGYTNSENLWEHLCNIRDK